MLSKRFRNVAIAVAALAGLSALSCADDPNEPGEPVPTSLVIVSGSGQAGVVAAELAQPLVVEVRDGSNNPLPGVVVNFVVVKGGGSVFAGAAETDNNGRASDYWRLGTSTADSQVVQVRSVSGGSGTKEVHGTFIATALPGPVASVAIPLDTIRLNWIGDTSSIPAAALDEYGNVVPGAAIRYRVVGTDGVAAVDSMTGLLTAQALGSRRVRAYVGLIGDSARAVITPIVANIEPAAETLVVNSLNLTVPFTFAAYDSGGSAIADPGELRFRSLNGFIVQVPDSLIAAGTGIAVGLARIEVRSVATGVRDTMRVRVQQVVDSVAVSPPISLVPIGDSIQLTGLAFDSNRVAIAGAVFTWRSNDTTRVRVNAQGVAYGVGYGSAAVRARTSAINGFGSVLVRNADTLSLVLEAGNGQAGIVAQPLGQTFAVRVMNQFGEGIGGVPVVWWSPDGPDVDPLAPVSDSEGYAHAMVTLDTVAGLKTAYATIGHDTVAFALVGRPDVPASFMRNSPIEQLDTVGDVVPALPRVRVADRFGNGIPGLEVRFQPRSGSTGAGTSQITRADGRAAIGSWALDSVPGSDTLFATLRDTMDTSFPRLRFVATVVQDSGSFQRSLVMVGDTVRERDSIRVDVQLVDRFGNPLIKPDGGVTLFSQSFGTFDPVVDDTDGSYRASFRPNGGRGLTRIYARLDGDSIWAVDSVWSRSYQLTWLGTSGNNFQLAGNWGVPGGPPSNLDSLYITTENAPPVWPALVQNVSVERVFLGPNAYIDGVFDLTVTGDFIGDPLSGGVTTGRVIMTGIAKLVSGRMRNLRVLNSTSLSANVTVTGGRIVVQGGRLRSTGFRVRVAPQ